MILTDIQLSQIAWSDADSAKEDTHTDILVGGKRFSVFEHRNRWRVGICVYGNSCQLAFIPRKLCRIRCQPFAFVGRIADDIDRQANIAVLHFQRQLVFTVTERFQQWRTDPDPAVLIGQFSAEAAVGKYLFTAAKDKFLCIGIDSDQYRSVTVSVPCDGRFIGKRHKRWICVIFIRHKNIERELFVFQFQRQCVAAVLQFFEQVCL